MEFLTLLLTGIGTLIFLYFTILRHKRPKNYPPGPTPLPLFGNVFNLGLRFHENALTMSKIYGNIVSLWMGSYRVVLLNHPDDIREALNRSDFAGRGHYNAHMDENHGVYNEGIIFAWGKEWQERRRFALKSMRDFGMGRRTIEGTIQDELAELLVDMRKMVGSPMSTKEMFNSSALNVIWSVIAGTRYPHHDEQLQRLIHLLHDFMTNVGNGVTRLFFLWPWLVEFRNKFPFLFSISDAKKFKEELFVFLGRAIDEHRQTIELGNPRDFIDVYLEEQFKIKETGMTDSVFAQPDPNDESLKWILFDFFLAGSDTTSTTLNWCLFILAMHPKIQEEFYAELQNVVGNRQVILADRPNLPYTEAVITEIQRISTISPFAAPHATTQDVTFKNYKIPKDTLILANFYGAHFHPDVWEEPHVFNPQRFLSADGKSFQSNKSFMIFGVGKRSCLGERLARDEVHVFLTNIVQNFKITMPKDEPQHSMAGVVGGIFTPEPHRIILLDRHN